MTNKFTAVNDVQTPTRAANVDVSWTALPDSVSVVNEYAAAEPYSYIGLEHTGRQMQRRYGHIVVATARQFGLFIFTK